MGGKQSRQQLKDLTPPQLAFFLATLGPAYSRHEDFIVSNGIDGDVLVKLSERDPQLILKICLASGMTESEVTVIKEKLQDLFHNKSLNQEQVAVVPDNVVLAFGFLHIADTLGYRGFPELAAQLGSTAIAFLGFISRAAFIAFFVLFFYTGFNNRYYLARFLATNADAGRCKIVPKVWNIPELLADANGNWFATPSFNPALAMYSFSLFGFEASMKDYEIFMSKMQNAIARVGAIAKTQTFAENLLWWNSWSHNEIITTAADKEVMQSLMFTGDSIYIVSKDFLQGTTAGILGDCPIDQTAVTYDRNVGDIVISFQYSRLQSDAICRNILLPKELGYNPLVTGDYFSITVGVRALFTAVAGSYQVNGPDTLKTLVTIDTVATGTYHGVNYTVQTKFDPNFPTMRPLYCIGPAAGPMSAWNCMFKVGNLYGIPFLTDAGSNYTFPVPCDCSLPSGRSPICNNFNLTLGFIMYNYKTNNSVSQKFPKIFRPFLPILEYFYLPPAITGKETNKMAFYPAWTAVNGQNLSYSKDSAWRQKAYAFTQTKSFGYGALVVFSAASTFDRTISAEKYQLRNGACTDSFSSAPGGFERLVSQPFGALEEVYKNCLATLQNSLIASAGGVGWCGMERGRIGLDGVESVGVGCGVWWSRENDVV